MLTFIKSSNLVMIKKKLIILYILNVIDIIFTLALLQTGFFSEANIFMVNAVQSPVISFLIKIILPALLLYYLYKKICMTDSTQLKATNVGINISLSIYCLVNLSHLIWTALLPYLFTL